MSSIMNRRGFVSLAGACLGVNCAQKEMKVRFWEGEDIIYRAKL